MTIIFSAFKLPLNSIKNNIAELSFEKYNLKTELTYRIFFCFVCPNFEKIELNGLIFYSAYTFFYCEHQNRKI